MLRVCCVRRLCGKEYGLTDLYAFLSASDAKAGTLMASRRNDQTFDESNTDREAVSFVKIELSSAGFATDSGWMRTAPPGPLV